MKGTRRPLALVRKHPAAPRWPYVITGLVAFMFVGHAVEDAGWSGAWPYFTILGLSAASLLWPTILGWVLLMVPFVAYGVVVAMNPQNGPFGEWLIFLALGLSPACLLWLGRPWGRELPGQAQPKA